MKHGKHYRHSSFDALDVIEEWKLSFSMGNVIKYIQRNVHTQNPDDLEKALWYLVYTMKGREQADKVVTDLSSTWGNTE